MSNVWKLLIVTDGLQCLAPSSDLKTFSSSFLTPTVLAVDGVIELLKEWSQNGSFRLQYVALL